MCSSDDNREGGVRQPVLMHRVRQVWMTVRTAGVMARIYLHSLRSTIFLWGSKGIGDRKNGVPQVAQSLEEYGAGLS